MNLLHLVLAHSVVYFTREALINEYGPGVLELKCCGDGPPPSESAAAQMAAYTANLPAILRATNAQVLPTAQAQLAADQAVSPAYSQLQTDLYAKYGPQLNKIGADIANANLMSGLQGQVAGIQGPGSQLVTSADQLQRQLDPEFYQQRQGIGNAIGNLLGSMDPTKLSGAEREEITRSLAQSRGITNPNSALDTVSNAMTFGSALQQKQSNFSQALAQAAQSLPALKSGINAFGVATGQPIQPNSGNQVFQGNTQNTGQNAFNMGNNFLGQTGAQTQTWMNKQSTPLQWMSGLTGGKGIL